MKTQKYLFPFFIAFICALYSSASIYDTKVLDYESIGYPLTDCVYIYGVPLYYKYDWGNHPCDTLLIPENAVVNHRSQTVLGIRHDAFNDMLSTGCTLILPKTLVHIGERAFKGTTVTNVVFPSSCHYRNWTLDTIPSGAFSECRYLQKIALPSSIERIEDEAFYGCCSLTSLYLPGNLSYIGAKAFAGCDNLLKIVSYNMTPPELKSFESWGDEERYDNFDFNRAILYVYGAAVEAYRNAPGWKNFSCILPFSEMPIDKIEIPYQPISVKLNTTEIVYAKVYPENFSSRYEKLEWSSSDTTIFTVQKYEATPRTDDAEIIPHKSGTARLIARIGQVETSCDVEVTNIPATSISIEEDEIEVELGNSVKLTVNIIPVEAADYLKWSSDKPEVAYVERHYNYYNEPEFYVYAKKAGECTITAENGDASDSFKVKVPPRLAESVTITDFKEYISVADTVYAIAKVAPSTTSDKTVNWSSDNDYVADVNSEGRIIGRHAGACVITARCGDKKASRKIWVHPDSFYFEKEKYDMFVNDSIKINIICEPPSDAFEDAVTVEGPGLVVKGTEVGTKRIIAYVYSKSKPYATCTVAVHPIPVESFSIPKNLTLKVGEVIDMEYVVSPENATSYNIRWESNRVYGDVISVDYSTGKVTAVGPGTAKINAKCFYYKDIGVTERINVECDVTVLPIPAESVTLTADGETSLKGGETVRLTAIVAPENTTDKTITWSSSDEAIATVDNTGLVTAHGKTGVAVITATCGSVSGSILISVLEDSGIDSIIAEENISICVVDICGRIIYNGPASNMARINLAPGIYMVHKNNGKSVKIVIR